VWKKRIAVLRWTPIKSSAVLAVEPAIKYLVYNVLYTL
jgi:hypothetical protein